MPDTPASALKNLFDADRLRHIAAETAALDPRFDAQKFLALALDGLASLGLMQRLRHTTQALHATLPADYLAALAVLRQLAPRINHGFVTLVLPDYVGLYGHDEVDASMDALKFFTVFGSSEFAVREFLKRDPARTLAVMTVWAQDSDAHVRRLASEGSRPRLPWSFRLDAMMADPALAAPILEQLRADPSLYVRKSVANHLNDITKTHPDWVLQRLQAWPLHQPPTAWVARHALRTLIKQGDRRALALVGAGQRAEVTLQDLAVRPTRLVLGEWLDLSFTLTSTASPGSSDQRLVVDYRIHYVKKAGHSTAKVFKLKTLTLATGSTVQLSRRQVVKDFSTRTHHAGRHAVEIMVNGDCLGQGFFELVMP